MQGKQPCFVICFIEFRIIYDRIVKHLNMIQLTVLWITFGYRGYEGIFYAHAISAYSS